MIILWLLVAYIINILLDMPLNEEIKWIVFHGGFDFGYLVEMLHHSGLPEKSDEFMRILGLYFPTIMDLKF